MEARSATRRSVRLNKVKPPRPRRSISEPAPVPDDPNIKIIESLHQKLIDGVVCHTDVSEFLGHVNTNGQLMELQLKERLDGLFDVIRLSMVESEMETRARMHLLQLLELRAGGWRTDDTRTNFYKSKCRCLGMKEDLVTVQKHCQWRSNSDSSDMRVKKPSPLKPRRESSDMVTHDRAAGDSVTLPKTPPVFDIKKPTVPRPRIEKIDTVTHDKAAGDSVTLSKTSQLCEIGTKKPTVSRPRIEKIDAVTHDNAAGDTVTLSKTPRVFGIPDTLTHAKTSALYGAGEPQLNSHVIPSPLNIRDIPLPSSTRDIPPPSKTRDISPESNTSVIPSLSGLHRCSSVPSEVTKGSGFSRFRSLSDRRFPETVAPSPWSCSSSVNELAHLGNDMRERTCSPSPEPDPDQECITYTGEALLAYAESPHAKVPPQDWSYLSKVFPEVCHTQVDDYFHMSSYVPPYWNMSMLRHSTKRDVDVSSGFRGGFPCSKRQEGDISSASIRGGFPCSKRQDGDVSPTLSRGGFPCSKRQDGDVSPTLSRGGFPCSKRQDGDVSPTLSRGGFPCSKRQDGDVSPTLSRGGFPCSKRQDGDVSPTLSRGGFPCSKRQDGDVSPTLTRGGFPCSKRQDGDVSSSVTTGGFPCNTKQDGDVSSTVIRGGFPCNTKQNDDVSSTVIREFPGSTKQVADISSTTVTNGGFPSNTKEDTGISSTVVKGGFPTFTKQDDDITSTVVREGFPGFKKQGFGISSSLVRGFPDL